MRELRGECMSAMSIKPHLQLIERLWYCIGNGACGYGYTPRSAYDEWRSSLRRLSGGYV